MIELGPLEYIKLAIYYASYLYLVIVPLVVWLALKSRQSKRIVLYAFLIAVSCLAYGRFFEPRILLSVKHDVTLDGCFEKSGHARIAVFSDTHQGLFGNAMPIRRISSRVNAIDADFVLIAGDFVYFLHPDQFEKSFTGLGDIHAPLFAVLGNHDLGLPGPDLSEALREALPRHGVQLIDDRSLAISNSKFAIEVVGLSDQWAQNQKLSLLSAPADKPRVVLTHNPATIGDLQPGMQTDLLIGGHTHGGQINMPIVTCQVTGVCGDVGYGLRQAQGIQIFTTSGTGMVGLPMRFRMPPRIDVLNLRYKACAKV